MDTKQILILVGLGIYYFVKSRNKNANEPERPRSAPQRPQARKQDRTIEDILRDMTEKTSQIKTELRTKIEPEPDASEPVEYQARPTRRKKTPIVKLKVEELDERSDFDLRQAIIYDAILNRPFQ